MGLQCLQSKVQHLDKLLLKRRRHVFTRLLFYLDIVPSL